MSSYVGRTTRICTRRAGRTALKKRRSRWRRRRKLWFRSRANCHWRSCPNLRTGTSTSSTGRAPCLSTPECRTATTRKRASRRPPTTASELRKTSQSGNLPAVPSSAKRKSRRSFRTFSRR
uniref:(northern house mosquito) hypothetical protein n=1 Tax=Culex pipiens TaxID=7175 RepID=A0A8D8DLN4_CULPI